MPIYEYRCTKCSSEFEALQSLGSDGADLTCPDCGEAWPDKLFSAFSAGSFEGNSQGGCSPSSGFS